MDDVLAQNEARARRLALVAVVPDVVLGIVIFIVAILIGWLPLPLLWAVVAVVGTFLEVQTLRRRAPERTLWATGAHSVAEGDEPRLHNLVEGLCVGIGLAPPRLHVIEDDAPNALAVARSVDDADLVVTRGLLDQLSLVELEAVLAHELARIRRGEAIVGALAAPTLGGAPSVSLLPTIVLSAPIARAIIGRGEPIESWSDLAAVDITRYPPGLAAALETLAAAPTALPAASSSSVAHLWIHGAQAEGAFGRALACVYEPAPPVGQRIEVLEEL